MPEEVSMVPELQSFEGFAQSMGDIEFTNYGYPKDRTPDDNSNRKRKGLGGTRPLVPGYSVALDKGLADRLKIQAGAILQLEDSLGNKKIVEYADRVPDSSVDGAGTVDIFLPDSGRNDFAGKLSAIKILAEGDGKLDADGAYASLGRFSSLFPEGFQDIVNQGLADAQKPLRPTNVGGFEAFKPPRTVDQNGRSRAGTEPGSLNQAPLSYSQLTGHKEYKEADPRGRANFLRRWEQKGLKSLTEEKDVKTFQSFVATKINQELSGRGKISEGGTALQEGFFTGLTGAASGVNKGLAVAARSMFDRDQLGEHLGGAEQSLRDAKVELSIAEDAFSGAQAQHDGSPEGKAAALDRAREAKARMTAARKEVSIFEEQIKSLRDISKENLENPKTPGGKVAKFFIESQDAGSVIIDRATEQIRARSERSDDFKELLGGFADKGLVALGEMPALIGQSLSVPGAVVLAANMGKRRADEALRIDPDLTNDEYLAIMGYSGVAESLIERGGVNHAVAQLFKGGGKMTGKEILQSMTTEGFEEVAQSIVGGEIIEAVAQQDIDTLWSAEAFQERIGDFLLGAIVAGPIAIPTAIASSKRESSQELQGIATRSRERALNTDNEASSEIHMAQADLAESIDHELEAGTAAVEADLARQADKQTPAKLKPARRTTREAAEAPVSDPKPAKLKPAKRTTRATETAAEDTTGAEPVSTESKVQEEGSTPSPSTRSVEDLEDDLSEANNFLIEARSLAERKVALKQIQDITKELTQAQESATAPDIASDPLNAEAPEITSAADAQSAADVAVTGQTTNLDKSGNAKPTQVIASEIGLGPGSRVRHSGASKLKGSFFVEPSERSDFKEDGPSAEFTVSSDANVVHVDITDIETGVVNKGVSANNPAIQYAIDKGFEVDGMTLKTAEAIGRKLAKSDGVDVISGIVRTLENTAFVSEAVIVNDSAVNQIPSDTQEAREQTANLPDAGSTPARSSIQTPELFTQTQEDNAKRESERIQEEGGPQVGPQEVRQEEIIQEAAQENESQEEVVTPVFPDDGKVRSNIPLDRATDKVAEIGENIAALPKKQQRAANDRFAEVFQTASNLADQQSQGRDPGGAGEFGDVATHAIGSVEGILNEQGRSVLDEDVSMDEIGRMLNTATNLAHKNAAKKASRSVDGEGVVNVDIDNFEGISEDSVFNGEEFEPAPKLPNLPIVSRNEPTFMEARVQLPINNLSDRSRPVIEAYMAADQDAYQAALIMWPDLAEESATKLRKKFSARYVEAKKELRALMESEGKSFSPTADLGNVRLMSSIAGFDDISDLILEESNNGLSALPVMETLVDHIQDSPYSGMINALLSSDEVRNVLSFTKFETIFDGGPNVSGVFNRADSSIGLSEAWATRPDQAAQTMYHEMIHALTEYSLKNDSRLRDLAETSRQKLIETLPAKAQELAGSRLGTKLIASNIQNGIDFAEENGEYIEGLNSEQSWRVLYAASNNFELLAEGMSSPTVSKALANIPSTRPRTFSSLWSQLLKAFKSALGISEKNTFTDILDQFMEEVTSEGASLLTFEQALINRELFRAKLEEEAGGFTGFESLSPAIAKPQRKAAKNRQKQFAEEFAKWDGKDDYTGDARQSIEWAKRVIMATNTDKLSDAARRTFVRHIKEFVGTKSLPPSRRAIIKAATDIMSDTTSGNIVKLMNKGSVGASEFTQRAKGLINDTNIEKLISNDKDAEAVVKMITSSFTEGLKNSPHKGSIFAAGETKREVLNLEKEAGAPLRTYESHTKPYIRNLLLTTSPKLEENGVSKGKQIYHNYLNILRSISNVAKSETISKAKKRENLINNSLMKEFAVIAKQAFDEKITHQDAASLMDSKLTPQQRAWSKAVIEAFASKTDRVKLSKNLLDRKGGESFHALSGYVPLVARSLKHDTENSSVDFENLAESVATPGITERSITHGFERRGVGGSYYVLSGKEAVREALSNINLDFHTSPQRQTFNRFFGNGSQSSSIQSKSDMGNRKVNNTVKTLKHVVTKQVVNEMNRSRLGGEAVRIINEIKKFGYITALAHIRQPINQLAPLFSYAITSGANRGLVAMSNMAHIGGNRMLKEWALENANDIHSRELDGAFDNIRETESRIENEEIPSKLGRGYRKLQEAVGKAYIGFSDKIATQGIFAAEYMHAALANGTISKMSYEEAFSDPSKVDEDALRKARQAVTNYNAESADAKKGSWFQRSPDTMGEIARNSLLVFATHQSSIAATISSSTQRLFTATNKEDRTEAFRNLSGAIAQEAIFVGISSGMIALLLSGEDDEKEREKIYKKAYGRALDAAYTSVPFANLLLTNSIMPDIVDFQIDNNPFLDKTTKKAVGLAGIKVGKDAKLTHPEYPGSFSIPQFGVAGIGASEVLEILSITGSMSQEEADEVALLYMTLLIGQVGIPFTDKQIKRSDIKSELRKERRKRAKKEKSG